MSENATATHKAPGKTLFSRIAKGAVWVFGAFLCVIFLLALLIFLLPQAVSTQWVREKAVEYATQTIQRPVRIQHLSWTWKGGILVEGLEIDDDPAWSDSPILAFRSFLVSIDFRQLLKRRLAVDAALKGVRCSLIKAKDGATNLESLLSGISRPSAPPSEPKEKSPEAGRLIPPPIQDIQLRVSLDDMTLRVDDREQNRTVLVTDASFLLDVPSLVSKPVTLSFSAREELDGKPLPPVHFHAKILDLMGEDASLNLKGLSANIQGQLPGMEISLTGSAAERSLRAELALDLEPLRNAAAPFLSPPPPEMSGTIDLGLKAFTGGTDAEETIQYDLNVEGRSLQAAGGPLKEKSVGPLRFSVKNAGVFHPVKGALEMQEGRVRLQDESHLSFRGAVGGLKAPPVTVDLSMDALSLHLYELLSLARPFVPAGIRLNKGGREKSGEPKLEIQNATLTGAVPAGPARLKWDRLKLTVPFAESALSGSSAILEGFLLNVSKGDITLASFLPTRAEATADIRLQALRVAGKETISLQDFRIPRFHLLADKLSLSPDAFFGVAGEIELAQSLSFQDLNVSKRIGISDLRQSLDLQVILPPSPSLSVTTCSFSASSPSLQGKGPPLETVAAPFGAGIEIKDLLFIKDQPDKVQVKEAKVSLSAGKIVSAQINARMEDSGLKKLLSDGTVALDLTKALPLLPSAMRTTHLKGGDLGGRIDLRWNYDGRRPTSKEMEIFLNNNVSIKEKAKAAAFVKSADIQAALTGLYLNIPLEGKGRISVDGIHTPKPLKFSLQNGLEQVKVGGDIALDGIRELPLSAKIGRPATLTLSFSGAFDQLEALNLSEHLTVEPVGLRQSFTVALSGLDRFLAGTEQEALTNALQKLRGTVRAALQANPGPDLTPYLHAFSIQGVEAAGTVEAALGLAFDGQGGITGRVQIDSPHLDATLKDRIRLKNLKMAVDLEKKLHVLLSKDGQPAVANAPAYLSVKVLGPSLSARPPTGNRQPTSSSSFAAGGFPTPFASIPALAFDSLYVKMDPIPVALTDFALQLRLQESLPVIDSFQFDVLGGTWVGDLYLFREQTEKDDLYLMEMNGSFTGIDAAKALPQTPGSGKAEGPAGETELAGSLSLYFPISSDPKTAMNRFSGAVRLTHIGPKTLERFLYAMDPSESNETIRKQRAILRQGTPLWITVEIQAGNLSLAGEVLVKGARIALPAIQRFNITALPIQQKLEKALSAMGPVVNALKTLSANAIVIENGKVKLLLRTLP